MRCLNEDFTQGSIFHIYNHAISDQLLFYDDLDYEYFLITFSKQLNKIPASVIAYCLMPNHYHFLIKQDSENKIYKIFNFAFVSYAKYFNKKYGNKGRIFRAPLQHKIVDDQTYLIQLCKYIHLNPVYAGLVEEPVEWEYSNYKEWIKERESKLYSEDISRQLFPNYMDYVIYIESIYNSFWHSSFQNLNVNFNFEL